MNLHDPVFVNQQLLGFLVDGWAESYGPGSQTTITLTLRLPRGGDSWSPPDAFTAEKIALTEPGSGGW